MIIHKFYTGTTIYLDDEYEYFIKEFLLSKLTSKNTSYVSVRDKKTRKYLGLLHCLIMKPKRGFVIDHINGNGLDNRLCNLREVTKSQNQFNRKLTVNKVKGVFFRKDRNCYAARITVNNKIITLGHFNNYEDAVKARLKAEKIYHGEYSGLGTDQQNIQRY